MVFGIPLLPQFPPCCEGEREASTRPLHWILYSCTFLGPEYPTKVFCFSGPQNVRHTFNLSSSTSLPQSIVVHAEHTLHTTLQMPAQWDQGLCGLLELMCSNSSLWLLCWLLCCESISPLEPILLSICCKLTGPVLYLMGLDH